jgi:hypothetical protein
LTTEKLREWTSRRALIPADVRPERKGSPAKYAWQTVLVLRVAVTLRDRFHLELQAHKHLFDQLRRDLTGKSFIALWGCSLALFGDERWEFVGADESGEIEGDAMVLRLDPHLIVLSEGFALPAPAALAGQLQLFPVHDVNGAAGTSGNRVLGAPVSGVERRRSA